ncbi:unnamed protein product [Brassicogethes aeneus]|uniref:Anoctamin n=1 Tax=Brassicogethes aeneus TaxID=1431903 RepID=A0A9P0FFB7_BRAAE|nr:unnamed protein product [Brassicogethes aeneus]
MDPASYKRVWEYIRKGRKGGGAYFKDEVRKVHYVLVLNMTSAYTNFAVISEYIRNLEDKGLEFEQDLGIVIDFNISDDLFEFELKTNLIPVMFVKIHIAHKTSQAYFNMYRMIPEFHEDFEASELSYIKIKIIELLLKQTQFGVGEDKKGIQKLVSLGVVQDYYALHTGTIQYEYWHNDALLNDRTLLAKYWASYRVWHKEQPLDLIHKYFGTEVAFHFAWTAHYNLMIMPAALLGVFTTIYGIIRLQLRHSKHLGQVCTSDTVVCGNCFENEGCEMRPLKEYCSEHTIITYLENEFSPLFAILVSVWGFVIVHMWKRKEYILRTRWNLHKPEPMETIESYDLDDFQGDFRKNFRHLLAASISKVSNEPVKIFVDHFSKTIKLIKFYMYEQLKKYPMAQYEDEYSKKIAKSSLIDQKYSEKVIQFGMLIGFVYSFPLAPMCALIHNILSLRREAIDLVYNTRRPVSTQKIYSTKPWLSIMDAMVLFTSILNVKLSTIYAKEVSLVAPPLGCYHRNKSTNLNLLSKNQLINLYYAQIESRLRYGVCFWGMSTLAQDIFIAQKKALRFNKKCKRSREFECVNNPDNLGDVSDEHGERFHQQMKAMERRYHGFWNAAMIWSLIRETEYENNKQGAVLCYLLNFFLATYNTNNVRDLAVELNKICRLAVIIFCGEIVDRSVVKFNEFLFNENVTYKDALFSEFQPFGVFGKAPNQENTKNLCIYRGIYYGPHHPEKYEHRQEQYQYLMVKCLAFMIIEVRILKIRHN